MATFHQNSDPVYITNADAPQELFPGLQDTLISEELSETLMGHIRLIADEGIRHVIMAQKTGGGGVLTAVSVHPSIHPSIHPSRFVLTL